jgi:hypothetical protein
MRGENMSCRWRAALGALAFVAFGIVGLIGVLAEHAANPPLDFLVAAIWSLIVFGVASDYARRALTLG